MARNVHKSLYNKLKAEIAMITGQEKGNISDLQYWYQNITFQAQENDENEDRILFCSECEASLVPERSGRLPKHKADCPILLNWFAVDRSNKL